MDNSLLDNEQNKTAWADFDSKAEPLKTQHRKENSSVKLHN